MTALEWLVEEITEKYNFRFSTYYGQEIQQAKEMEKQQQEEFAIGFVEWIYRNDYSIQFYFQQDTMNELLEIYKKEISNEQ